MSEKPRGTVATIAEYTEWVDEVGEFFTRTDRSSHEREYYAPWFRGHGHSEYKLIPGLYRTEAGREDLADDELRNEFMRRGLPMVADRAPRNDWEWYFLMQHFRAPTRLLDWTDSAFVALYFAITSWKPASAKKKAVPAVWALNPFTLNWETIKKWGAVGGSWKEAQPYLPEVYRDAKLPKYPIAIDPELTAQRMVVQRSHFTIHGSDMRSMEEMREEIGLHRDLFKVIIDIDGDGVDYLKWHLTLLGITETALFPDLEGLARELRSEYGLDKSRPIS